MSRNVKPEILFTFSQGWVIYLFNLFITKNKCYFIYKKEENTNKLKLREVVGW